MREQHIAKIIDNYRDRVNEDKYSYVASIDLIKNNAWNLNISRYVDSLETEELIDLDLLFDEISKLETNSSLIEESLKIFCSELGIKPPFSIKKD